MTFCARSRTLTSILLPMFTTSLMKYPFSKISLVASILSSNEDVALPKDYCFAAEVGLSGEIRPVQRVEQRILEAEKLGFTTIFVSKYNKISLKNTTIKIQLLSKIEDLIVFVN